MKFRILVLLAFGLISGACEAPPRRVPSQENQLAQRFLPFLTPTPDVPDSVTVFDSNGTRHGGFMFGGQSDTTTTDFVGVATRVATAVREQFVIPPDYTWTPLQGGPMERKLIEPVGPDGWKTMGFGLFVDGVPVDGSGLGVSFDAQGRTRLISGKIPRLQPAIVSAVRGPRISEAAAANMIVQDAAGQPTDNPFGFTPGDTSVRLFALRLMAITKAPFLVYTAYAKDALYMVSAVDGTIVSRELMMVP